MSLSWAAFHFKPGNTEKYRIQLMKRPNKMDVIEINAIQKIRRSKLRINIQICEENRWISRIERGEKRRIRPERKTHLTLI
ncbi:hypothetical protein Q3G72_028920 [Acer saccharum]|nr:hypothetical protein Q3G72_028920 [Acer saccharum]